MKNNIKYFAGAFLWGTGAKLSDALIKFLTIPLLLGYFGKVNFGILTLAVSTNAYMQLLDMGMNTGGVKFFAQWIASGDYKLIDRVARTNISFYILVGVLNSLILVALANFGSELFQITTEELISFKKLLYILSIFSIVNWATFVFNQLIIANERIIFTQQMMIVKSLLGLIVIGLTVFFQWSITKYFFFTLLSTAIIIFPYYLLCKKLKLIKSIFPAFYWKDFYGVFRYGLAILAMSLFQFTASQSRPLILGVFSDGGVGILAEYRIIEVFPVFILSIGGMLITIFLPQTSKAIQNKDKVSIANLAYQGTRYTSILVSILCFPIILNAQDLLTLYVGTEYRNLSIWLILWVFTLTLYLHNTPVASLVLSTGKTKMLVYSSAISCIISVILNIFLVRKLGVGSAVIGYLIYIIIQMGFYYLYFIENILNLNTIKVFKSFVIPTVAGFLTTYIVMFIPVFFSNLFFAILFKSGLWFVLYLLSLKSIKIVDFDELMLKFKINRIQ